MPPNAPLPISNEILIRAKVIPDAMITSPTTLTGSLGGGVRVVGTPSGYQLQLDSLPAPTCLKFLTGLVGTIPKKDLNNVQVVYSVGGGFTTTFAVPRNAQGQIDIDTATDFCTRSQDPTGNTGLRLDMKRA